MIDSTAGGTAKKSKLGGARQGAGRPRLPSTVAIRRRAEQYSKDGGVLPIDVMMGTMRALWADATTKEPDKRGKRKALKPHEYVRHTLKEAHEAAKDAAPYIHPKLATIETTGANGGPMEVLVKRAQTSLQALSESEFDTLMALMQKLGMVSGAQLANGDANGGTS